jgi:cardiolipin synthase
MNLPNLITVARILLVPVTVWLIINEQFLLAFLAFIAAGISDAVDGYLAKRLNQATELGAYLDPVADKALLVSIYVTLGLREHLPAWLVILVVSRDVLIVGGMLLAWLIGRPIQIRPLVVSKVNTVGQILLAGTVLGILGFGYQGADIIALGSLAVGILTVGSGAVYLRDGLRHLADGGGGEKE